MTDDPADELESLDALFGYGEPVKKKRRLPLESLLQEKIVDYLNTVPGIFAMPYGAGAFRVRYRHRQSGTMRDRFVKIGRAGVSDVIGWQVITVAGAPVPRWIAIEVKRPGEKPKPHQQRFLDKVTAAGGLAFVARSVEDVKKVLAASGPPSAPR